MNVDWARHGNKLAERLTDIIAGAFGAGVYHFLSEKRDKNGNPVLGKDGKPAMTLDSDKIRAHAPYFVLGLSDEAEFNGLVIHLDAGSQKNLEIQMGPIPAGRRRAGVVLSGLGDHQRADVILTTVQLNERKDIAKPRDETIKMLQQLADISDPAEWKRRAVAFKLMKAKESDYVGAQLSEQASKALLAALKDLTAFRQWMDASAAQHRTAADGIYAETAARANENVFFKIVRSFADAFGFQF